MKYIAIACGGTGGHLTPGIALAQELDKRGYGTTLCISSKSVDRRLCEHYNKFNFISMPGCAFRWQPIDFCKFIFKTLLAFIRGWNHLGNHPDAIVISFGGFSAVGLCLAAFIRRRPIFLHEANLLMGRAIRWLTPLAKKVYIPPALKELELYRHRKKYIPMYYPVRNDFLPCSMNRARDLLGLPTYGRCLVVSGGSQGARALIEWTRAHEILLITLGYHIICLAGPAGTQAEICHCHADGRIYHVRYKTFSDHMHLLYSVADLIVCRAGAGTIAELIRCQKPSVLVPYPAAIGDHQTLNARAHAEAGMAVLLPQSRLSELVSIIEALDDATLKSMQETLVKFDRSIGDPATALADSLLENSPQG
ncbi:MAG: UDP-N-acetylglucosamine--N-acetylmuramyl-(pentapeptide) pyrophosphoryl-undecaprenol N-acetylglucosamine transferase [Puniceicoccales bacterium]|jgi:UDP-N-acetylglucosamine--N-acetylmuramyl-(pentapeptide) pyrophosphoryl-undecaprenol N-acetylglucosamine transferase|nr:UDP-N-acetylglucosamine--N-acetylmuramyl-(pentapeptide) pyrophosphoryl-undecaprenol N-acetylglucosamine transferase [Puniceicoccales bacterium]